MAQQDRSTLKPFFETGDRPTESQFSDLIDSFLNKTDEADQIVPAPTSGDAGKISRIKSDESGWGNYPIEVSTISDLKSLDTSGLYDGAIVKVNDYDSSIEGSGGLFEWQSSNTDTENEYDIIKPTFSGFSGTGRWRRKSVDHPDTRYSSRLNKQVYDYFDPTIVCYGDSNTRFYNGTNGPLARAFSTSLEFETSRYPVLYGSNVINEGHSGETISYGVTNFSDDVTGNNADICVIGFGTNDIKVAGSDLSTYLSSYRTLLDLCVDNNVIPIILGIPYFDETYGDDGAASQAKIPVWNEALQNLAHTYNIPFVDAYGMFDGFNHESYWFSDTPARHYTQEATYILGKKIAEAVLSVCTLHSKNFYSQTALPTPRLDSDIVVSTSGTVTEDDYSIASYNRNTIKVLQGGSIEIARSGLTCFEFYPREDATVSVSGPFSDSFTITSIIDDGLFYPISKYSNVAFNINKNDNVTLTATTGDFWLAGVYCEKSPIT